MRVWGGQAALVGETAEAGRQRFGQWFAGYVTRPTRHPPAKVPTSPSRPGRVPLPGPRRRSRGLMSPDWADVTDSE